MLLGKELENLWTYPLASYKVDLWGYMYMGLKLCALNAPVIILLTRGGGVDGGLFEVYIPTLETTIFVLIPTLESAWCIKCTGCKKPASLLPGTRFHKFVKIPPVRNGLLSKPAAPTH